MDLEAWKEPGRDAYLWLSPVSRISPYVGVGTGPDIEIVPLLLKVGPLPTVLLHDMVHGN